MDAETFFDHEFDYNPKVVEDYGTIKVNAIIIGIFDPVRSCTVFSQTEKFIGEGPRYGGGGNQVLKGFLMDAGIGSNVLSDLYRYLEEIMFVRRLYYPICSMSVTMTIDPIVEVLPVFFKSTTKPKARVAVRIYNDKTSSFCDCDTCAICLDDFCTGERVVTLRCDHVFHEQCIVSWYKTSLACPLCRTKLAF